jgi:Zn finger protein HypA/HybF involved in hydrogenase expression
MDAIGFRSTMTDVDPDTAAEIEEQEEPCTCESCRDERAEAYVRFHWGTDSPYFDESDETWQCPSCSAWHGTRKSAVLCCYVDDDWIEFCRSAGRSFT